MSEYVGYQPSASGWLCTGSVESVMQDGDRQSAKVNKVRSYCVFGVTFMDPINCVYHFTIIASPTVQ